MAYRENISAKGLEAVRALFQSIRTDKGGGKIPKEGFRNADSCVELLNDVKRLMKERVPRFTEWRSWGSGYWFEPDEIVASHNLGFGFFKKNWDTGHFLCAIRIPASNSDVTLRFRYYPTKEIFPKIGDAFTNGHVDAHKIADLMTSAARNWKV